MVVFETIFGATPIEDASALIPTHIMTQSELNNWETVNIMKATQKYLNKRKKINFTIEFIKKIHEDMFDETWQWAGKIRKTNLNVGIDNSKILEELKNLVDDVASWGKGGSDLGLFEQSVRIHHRLVKIHPFVNGNGRHARLVADVFLFSHNHKMPIWPNQELVGATATRRKYIEALQAADKGNYSMLENYVKALMR